MTTDIQPETERPAAELAPLGHMENIAAMLADLYDHAAAENDPAAADIIVTVWQQIETLHTALTSFVQAAHKTAEEFRSQRDGALEEVDGINQAVYWLNREHPLIGPLIESVEEEALVYAEEDAFDHFYNSIHDTIKPLGFSYDEAQRLVDLFQESGDLTAEQQAALKLFIEKLTETADDQP
jgi:hypothetical protein